MKSYSEIVMSHIDGVMRDCAKGNFSDDFAIQKIKAVVEAYTVYKNCLAKVEGVNDRAAMIRAELREVERDFDAACHERDDALEALDSMLDGI